MKKIIFFSFAIVLITTLPVFASEGIPFRSSVVKIFVHANPPDYFKPWQSEGVEQTTGSGCVINGNRILTSAHVVNSQTFIQVRKSIDSKKYRANVEAIAHDADLAILSVEDETFFEGTQPVPFGDLPKLQDTVTVIGYPQGGNQLSVTEGVVSRIEVTPYTHSGRALLTVQIDAAVNPGNSGGPVIQNGKLTGVAFQGLKEGENIGYIIPVPIIKHVLKDLEDGSYDGFPYLGVVTNKTENKTLKEYYQITQEDSGVLVSGVAPKSPADGFLREGDVIMEVDGTPVADDRTFKFRDEERLLFTYLLSLKQVGETLSVKIIREGKEENVEIPLKPYQNLVPDPYTFEQPPYKIYGGLVFTVLTQDMLRNWNPDWGPQYLINLNYYHSGPGRLRPKGRDEICILVEVLPDDINIGYHQFKLHVVDTVSGQQILSFEDLVQKLSANQERFVKIETEERAIFIIDRNEVETADQRIQAKYRIASLTS